MPDLAKAASNQRTDTLGWAVGAHQIGKGGLKVAVAGDQPVIDSITDNRVIRAMISAVVIGDCGGKQRQFIRCLEHIHLPGIGGTRGDAGKFLI